MDGMKRYKVQDYEPIPAGNYPVQCMEVRRHENPEHRKARLQFKLMVAAGEHKTQVVSVFCNEPKMLTRDSVLYRFGCVFLGRDLEQGEDFGPMDLVGLYAIAQVTVATEEGTGFQSNEVVNLHQWDGDRDKVDLALNVAGKAFLAAG